MTLNRELQAQLQKVIQWRWKRNRTGMGTNGFKAMNRDRIHKLKSVRENPKKRTSRDRETGIPRGGRNIKKKIVKQK